ncbi:hypothetical protein [Verrucomicrobium spinosum]|uniref:hypothetical protein n=1 Tax=Verrucomicrobium spinosum TaxID=2736 RepID=UPI00017452E2|nr:hypothetical protein [Verrucomicrobium spinosum]
MRKHRGDSNLKTLPEDQQEEIIARLEAKGGTQKKVAEWLAAEWDVQTSQAALSEFYSWFQMRRRFRSTESVTQDFQQMLQESDMAMSAEQISALGNLMFLAQATKDNDPKTFVAMARVLVQNRKIDVEERRVKLLEEKAKVYDQIKEATKGRPSAELTPEERQLVLQVMDESLGITNRK